MILYLQTARTGACTYHHQGVALQTCAQDEDHTMLPATEGLWRRSASQVKQDDSHHNHNHAEQIAASSAIEDASLKTTDHKG